MRTKNRSIGAMVLLATTLVLAACIPPPSGPPRPQLTVPDNIEVVATSSAGAIVTFEATGSFEGEPVPVVCDPESGSLFPVGTTRVRCTATNSEGTTRSRNFDVTVLPEGSSGTTTTTTTTTSTTSTTSTTTTSTTTTSSTTTTTSSTSTTVPSGDAPLALVAGDSHTCAIRPNGTLACWGLNNRGQLGDGSTDFLHRSARTVSGLTGVIAVDAGFRHTCALRDDGQVFCWGLNGQGQLGNGETTQTNRLPLPVSNMADAVDVATGELHSCAVRSNGSVACWGDGFSGALGGSQAGSLVPRTVPGVSNAVSVVAGGGFSCARLADNSVVCWGSNNNGQLGNGVDLSDGENPPPTSLLPVAVLLPSVSDLSAGDGFACATSSGSLYCWGENVYGQLGGTLENAVSTPLLVAGQNPAGVGAGADHACGRSAGGVVRCFGRNDEGQLGNGNRLDSLIRSGTDGEPTGYRTPVDVDGLSDVQTVASGGKHTCARRSNGTVACWGFNQDGQLGINTTQARRLVPTEVVGL